MRTLFYAGLLGLAGAALLDCTADGTTAGSEVDAGADVLVPDASPSDADVGPDADAGKPDAKPDADASTCSEDGWCRTTLPDDTLQLTAVWSFAEDDVLAASTTNLVHWDGTAWTIVDEPLAMGLTSLWATSATEIWGAAQFDHRLLQGTREQAGQPFVWTSTQYDFDTPTLDVIRGGASPSELWIFGTLFGQGAFQHGTIGTDDTGATTVQWATVTVEDPTLAVVNSFLVTGESELWIAGAVLEDFMGAGAILHGVPSEEDPSVYTWTHAFTGKTGDFTGHKAIWGSNASDIWSIGSVGQNYRGGRAADGSIAFDAVPSNANTEMASIWGTASNDLWVVGKGGAIRHWDGTNWNVSKLALDGIPLWKDLTAVHGGASGIWAVGSGVALHRKTGGTP